MKVGKKLIIITVILLVALLIALATSYYNKKQLEELRNEISKYDAGLYQFMEVVAYEDIDEYNSKSEIEILQTKLDRLILDLEGDAKFKYKSIDEAYIDEIKEYEETQSIDSLRNICYILNIRAEQDFESIMKYYRLLLEEVKDNKSLEEEIGYPIVKYIKEYLVCLYKSGKIGEYKYFFENADKYTRDPNTWALAIYEYDEYIDEEDIDVAYFHIKVLKEYEQKYKDSISEKIYMYTRFL